MQDVENVRSKAQLESMEKVKAAGACLFCDEGMAILGKRKLLETTSWFVTDNDFPYEGAVNHVLAIPKRHVTKPEELTDPELMELFRELSPLVQKEFMLDGYTLLFRAGNTKKTGATLHHLHIHFINGVEKTHKDHPKVVATVGYQK